MGRAQKVGAGGRGLIRFAPALIFAQLKCGSDSIVSSCHAIFRRDEPKMTLLRDKDIFAHLEDCATSQKNVYVRALYHWADELHSTERFTQAHWLLVLRVKQRVCLVKRHDFRQPVKRVLADHVTPAWCELYRKMTDPEI